MSRNSAAEMLTSPVPGVIPEPADVHDRPRDDVESGGARESRGARLGRKAHRTRLHLYAFVAAAVLVYGVALAATNTRQVKVDWVFGSSSVSLVWLVLFAGILGWAARDPGYHPVPLAHARPASVMNAFEQHLGQISPGRGEHFVPPAEAL